MSWEANVLERSAPANPFGGRLHHPDKCYENLELDRGRTAWCEPIRTRQQGSGRAVISATAAFSGTAVTPRPRGTHRCGDWARRG